MPQTRCESQSGWCRAWGWALGTCALATGLVAAQAPTEYQIKAVYLFNFAQFVEWPGGAFADAKAPLAICVLGTDPFGQDLDTVVRGEIVNGRPLVVRRLGELEQSAGCHILYVSPSYPANASKVAAALRGKPVLSVGDSEWFARRGGVIRFVMQHNRVRLRISVAAANDAGIVISSKLLRIAEIVPTEGGV